MREKNKIKIYFVSNASDMYGAPKALLLILKKINRGRFDPHVICPCEGDLIHQIKLLGIQVHTIERAPQLKKLQRVLYMCKLFIFLVRNKIDLLYVNTVAHIEPIIIGKILNIKIIVHVREPDTWFDDSNLAKRLRLFVLLNFPIKFVCVSKATSEILLKRGISHKKVCLVYDGIEKDIYMFSQETRKRIRQELHISPEDILVGFVGQIIPRKGLDVLIEAANLIKGKNKSYKYLVLGGPLNSTYAEKDILPKVSGYNLEKDFIFLGFRENAKDYFSAFDIFVSTSKKEPFAMVNLESMAMKRVIIATNTGGSPEAIKDGETGIIIPVDNSEALAEKIIKLAENPALREEFGNAARRRLEEYFTIDRYYSNCEHEILKVLEEWK